jgi:hypothetical protein
VNKEININLIAQVLENPVQNLTMVWCPRYTIILICNGLTLRIIIMIKKKERTTNVLCKGGAVHVGGVCVFSFDTISGIN